MRQSKPTPEPLPKTSAPALLSRYWHVILFLLVCAIVAIRLNREPAQTQSALPVEPPPVSERSQPESESPIPHRRVAQESDETNIRSQEALRVLVQTHPAEEVRTQLNQWILDGRVWLNFQRDAVNRYGSIAAATYVNTPERGILLTLVVSPELLLDPQQSQAFRQLVIFHEYVHLRQQIQGTFPPEVIMGVMDAPNRPST